jgi:hypothetical protein
MSGSEDSSRRLRDAITASNLPINAIAVAVAVAVASGGEAVVKAAEDADAVRPADDGPTEINLSIAVALRPVDGNLQAAVQWLHNAPLGWKILAAQTDHPSDDTSQFSPLMTKLQQAIGWISSCVVSCAEMTCSTLSSTRSAR